MSKNKFLWKVRSNDNKSFVQVWLLKREGASDSCLLWGEMLPDRAEEVIRALPLLTEREQVPLLYQPGEEFLRKAEMMNKREKEQSKLRIASAREWAEKQTRGFEPTSVKLPDGVNFFKLERAGLYKIDALLYKVGKGNPSADEGMYNFGRLYYVHRGLGPDGKDSYQCFAKTFAKKYPQKVCRCYVCDWLVRNGKTADEEFVKRLRAQTRLLMNVINVGDREKKADGAVEVFDASFGSTKHPNFGALLEAKLKAVEDYDRFPYPEGGFTLQLTVVEDSWPGGKFFKVTNIEMLPRKYDYPLEMLEKCVCLDDCLVETPYDKLKKIMEQDPEQEEPSQEDHEEDHREENRSRSQISGNGKGKEEDDEGDEDEDQKDEEKPGKKNTPPEPLLGKKVYYKKKPWTVVKDLGDGIVRIEDEDGATKKVMLEDLDHGEKSEEKAKGESEEDELPRRRTKVVSRVKQEEEEEPEEDEEDEEDESPLSKRR